MSFQPQERGPLSLTRGLLESETKPRELSAEFVFTVLVSGMLVFLSLPLCWVFFPFSFHHGVFTKVGFCCGWPPLHRGRAEVVSARLNLSHGTIYVGGVCNFLVSVSLWQKFEATDGPIIQPCVNFLGETSVTAPRNFFRQSSVIAPCYSSVLFRKLREIHPWGVRPDRPKRREEKRSPWLNFCSLFYTCVSSPLSLPFVNLASREGCLFYLRFSLQFLGLPLFFLRDFSLLCLLASTTLDSIFPILTT